VSASKPLIVITGASSGIGEATARAFSAAGHPLLLLARRVKPMAKLGLPDTLALSLDVTDRAAFADAIAQGEARSGPVDALINNAGTIMLGRFTTQNPEEWDPMVDVNVKGLMNSIHAVALKMVNRRAGTVINISSVGGIKPLPNHVAYVGTKFAASGLSENLREELAPANVRVITIAPGGRYSVDHAHDR
jgi:NADP-dependent 3-hydroxy acid dehydrogenase YdfG